MNIFHIITHFDIGGAERVAVNIAHSSTQSMNYHLIEVVRGNGKFNEAFIDELEKANIHYHCSPIKNNKLGIIVFPFRFIFIAFKWKPRIIHTHTEIPDLSIFLWSRLFGWMFPHVRYVRTIHNTELWNQWTLIGKMVEKFFKKECANIAISESTQSFYNKIYGELPPIILNGLASVEQQSFRYLIKDKINILFAGRLEFQKGIDQLIKVIVALKENKRFYFHVVGSGSMKEKVYTFLEALPNVSLYDKVFGLNQYIGSFDYLFMPSNYEGLGLVAIEASLAHTPSIINNCVGLKDAFPKNWPLKVENNNVDDFVKLICSLDNNNFYNEYSDMVFKFAKENFSVEKMQHEYELVYMRKK